MADERLARMMENQRKREEAMREREAEARRRSAERRKKTPTASAAVAASPGSSQYDEAAAARRAKAEERLRMQEEDMRKRAEERRQADLRGEAMQTEWQPPKKEEPVYASTVVKPKKRMNPDEYAALKAAGKDPKKIAADMPKDMPKQACMWGCKCPGYAASAPAGGSTIGPVTCKNCPHAKGLHHL